MAERLRASIPEITRRIQDRLRGLEGENPVRDPDYLASLAGAVKAGVDYGIEVIAVGEDRAGEVPLPLLYQARCAARFRIPLELAMRRYLAAERQLTAAAQEEAADLDPDLVREALASLTAATERLTAAAAEEYAREKQPPSSHEARQIERVRRLLDGELADPGILEYDVEGHHLGLFANSDEARPLLRRLASECDYRYLILTPSPVELWAWIGRASEPVDAGAVREWLGANGTPQLPIGVGEPKSGRSGLLMTHQQASAAAWVAKGRGTPYLDYADAALFAVLGRDPLLTRSLYETFLLPLAGEPDGGECLRQTLRAYFRASRNASSAGSSIGVSRQTVSNRVRQAERYLGRQLEDCSLILEVALELEELGCFTDMRDSRS